jgi:hypothetical protein
MGARSGSTSGVKHAPHFAGVIYGRPRTNVVASGLGGLTMFKAKQAVRTRRPLKISMEGLSGGGKTYTALRIAFDMKRNGIGKRILVIDSENESAGLYAGQVEDGERWEFDTVDMPAQKRNPSGYAEAYEWAVGQGYDILIFDSLSHAWHGALEQVDQYAASHRNDKFGAWANVTPQQRMMLQTLTDPRAHCLTTLRVKTEFEDVVVNGRTKKQKVGMKADQREGTEYEFDLVLRFEAGNEVSVDKVRGCTAMNGKTVVKPGPMFWKPLFEWWKAGADVPAVVAAEPAKVKDDSSYKSCREALESAKTMPELQKAWGYTLSEEKADGITKQQLDSLIPVKDAAKARLTNPQQGA